MKIVSISLIASAVLLLRAFAQSNSSNVSNSSSSTSPTDPLLMPFDYCSPADRDTTGFNSSASISYPGYVVNEKYPVWTWTRYIAERYYQTLNTSSVWEAVEVKTTPSLNLTNTTTLPYTGCYIPLHGIIDEKKHALDDGTCRNVLEQECFEELMGRLDTTKLNIQASYISNSSSQFNCDNVKRGLVKTGKEDCRHLWTVLLSTNPLPVSTPTVNSTTDAQSCDDIGNRDHISRTQYFLRWGNMSGRNFKVYDQALRNPFPLIIVTWPKQDYSQTPEWNVANNVIDTKVICIPANVTTPGSRNITEALKSAGTTRASGLSGAMFGVMILSLLWELMV
ncbi:hypothetical protein ONS95_007273 [Cadophora gregata]|uniref:uncharacterized protein n=1 Tax=Cadophora gregata TaxID=51156 RepID=UPI0026DD272C|nr:uncharacterized protein ONS95_007273 [Cadophora gregata]KAK0100825.1 hypothetical protein ONS95_007273 [Cadophora gregata]KAK0117181.1 hypothetical protein ONS96_013014 [Cadophora gregata f. sp. sojae]